jgi:hypothetical protein
VDTEHEHRIQVGGPVQLALIPMRPETLAP